MNKAENLQEDITDEDVETFCAYCENLVSTFNNFEYLYEKNQRKLALLDKHASRFFGELQHLLKGEMIISACKITDAAKSNVGREVRENLTTNFFVGRIDLSTNPDQREILKAANENMNCFRRQIIDARNKKVGHLDRYATVEDWAVGGFTRDDFSLFVKNLQIFVNIIHEHHFGSCSPISHASSAIELIEALEKAQKFDELQGLEKE